MGFLKKILKREKKEKVVAKKAVAAPAAKATPSSSAPRAKKAPAAKAKKSYEPQCGALTADGKQCKNSSRAGSKYCGAHRNYRPPTAVAARTDTKPAVAKAKDTKPARRKKAAPTASKGGLRPQCAALTAAGGQCQNSARAGSKYCGAHKGYQPPAKKTAAKAKDTRPAVRKAKDTKPAGRRTQVTHGDYALFQSGNRYFFSKKPQKDVAGQPVYAMPSGRTVVKTPNGLPVLKKT